MELLVSSGSVVYTGDSFTGVYGWQNHANSKWNVGESLDVLHRALDYLNLRCYGQPLIHKAFLKYGTGSFSCYKLEECPNEILHEREVHWGTLLNSMSPTGYNLRLGGAGKLIVSEETKQKISKKLAGMKRAPCPQKVKEKISKSLMGHKPAKISERGRQNQIQAMLGKQNNLGYKHTIEAKIRIGEAALGNQYAAGLIPWNKGKTFEEFSGEKNTTSKLKNTDIIAIRKRYDAGETAVSISGDYGVTATNISYIGKRKTWRHING